MNTQSIIGRNLKALRSKRGLSQEEVAQYLSIKQSMLSDYEIGERCVTLPELDKLANLYGVEMSNIFAEPNDFQPDNFARVFSPSGLTIADLHRITDFHKIVKNYLKMKLIKGEQPVINEQSVIWEYGVPVQQLFSTGEISESHYYELMGAIGVNPLEVYEGSTS